MEGELGSLHLLLFSIKVALHGHMGRGKINSPKKGVSRELIVCWQCEVNWAIQGKADRRIAEGFSKTE